MARIPTSVDFGRRRSPGVAVASANVAPTGMGAGLAKVGDTINRLATDFYRKKQVEAESRFNVLLAEEEAALEEARRDMPEGGDGWATSQVGRFQSRAESFMQDLPGGMRRDFESRFQVASAAYGQRASKYEIDESDRYQGLKIDEALGTFASAASANPTDASVLASKGVSIIDMSTLPARVKAERKRAFRQNISRVSTLSRVREDESFRRSVIARDDELVASMPVDMVEYARAEALKFEREQVSIKNKESAEAALGYWEEYALTGEFDEQAILSDESLDARTKVSFLDRQRSDRDRIARERKALEAEANARDAEAVSNEVAAIQRILKEGGSVSDARIAALPDAAAVRVYSSVEAAEARDREALRRVEAAENKRLDAVAERLTRALNMGQDIPEDIISALPDKQANRIMTRVKAAERAERAERRAYASEARAAQLDAERLAQAVVQERKDAYLMNIAAGIIPSEDDIAQDSILGAQDKITIQNLARTRMDRSSGDVRDMVEYGIESGAVPTIEEIVQSEQLTTSDKVPLIRTINERAREAREAQEAFERVQSGGLNVFSEGDRQDVDMAAKAMPEQAYNIALTSGIAPKSLIEDVRAGVANGDAATFQKVDMLQRAMPHVFSRDGGKPIMDALDAFRAKVNLGASVEDAARAVATPPDKSEAPALREKAVNDELKNVDSDEVLNEIGGGIFRSANVAEQDRFRILAEYRAHYREARKVMTPDEAEEVAKSRVGRLWGETSVGDGYVMQAPPEKFLPPVGGSYAYLREQLDDAVKSLDPNATEAYVLAVDATMNDIKKQDRSPRYQVMYRDADGALQFVNKPFRFDPSLAQEVETQRNREALEKKIKESEAFDARLKRLGNRAQPSVDGEE